IALEYGSERDRPEPASNDVRGITRVPPVTPHLAGIRTRGLDMQSIYGARDFGYQIGPLAREDQCLDEQGKPVGPHQAIDHRFRVGLRRTRASRRLFHTLGDMEDAATRGLDE